MLKSRSGSVMPYVKQKHSARIIEATARGGDSSLNAFIEKWSSRNSGPMDMLHRFLSHVSCYVDEVFANDEMVLSSCLTECFDLLTMRSGMRDAFAPAWYGEECCAEEK
eukprot:2277075-Ditylum_brightwellii.AAC.1